MKHWINLPFLTLLIGFIFLTACQRQNQDETSIDSDGKSIEPIFKLLTPAESNVNFANRLEEGLNTNILMYEYFYNGGGVAVGDFNQDQKIDLYFTSNMGENKLYINKTKVGGKINFVDGTTVAKVNGRKGPWKTGASTVDINSDGKLDIYICYSGALPQVKRKNQLFINTGNNKAGTPVFKEEAEKYGLASVAYSNQSYFFDYDKDGDLDMLLLNHNPKNLPILNEAKTKELLKLDDPYQGIRLYKQSDGKFSDVTLKSGISSSALTYGLGIGISDLNNDGWPDFYISNDYAVPDYLYLNNRNGTFTNNIESSIGHNSQFSMGNDIADINNDGFQDIVTLDMLPADNKRQKLLLAPDNYSKYDLNVRSGFHHQLMRNMLQLNNGNGTFSEIGQIAGISNTDWSWSALLADYDNDGNKDLFVSNGYNRDYTNLDFINYMETYVEEKGRLKREDVLQIIEKMPSSNLANYVFRGSPEGQFINHQEAWGMGQTANSNGAAYADLDNDGDLEIIVNNINKPAFIYENRSSSIESNSYLKVQLEGEDNNRLGIGASVKLSAGDQIFVQEQYLSRGYLSSVSPILNFGLGDISNVEELRIAWPSGKVQTISNIGPNQTLILKEENAKRPDRIKNEFKKRIFNDATPPLEYTHKSSAQRDFDRQPLLLKELSSSGPLLVKADVNGDKLDDIFVGGSKGEKAKLYIQNTNNTFTFVTTPDFEISSEHEDRDAFFFDMDNDNDLDLYIASGGYHDLQLNDANLADRLYENDGNGSFTIKSDELPELYENSNTIAASDINSDGYVDLFIGVSYVQGRWPETGVSYFLINDGKGKFSKSMHEISKTPSQVTDAIFIDLNGDSINELITVGEFQSVNIFQINQNSVENLSKTYIPNGIKGLWNKIEVADLNKDGKVDFILGNSGTNLQFKASEEQPAKLYYGDFDKNGSVDPIFTYFNNGISYPDLTRDELLSQLLSFRSKYTSYESYSEVTTEELMQELASDDKNELQLNYLKSCILLSTDNEMYTISELPLAAQFAPIHTMNVLDYNRDGNQDLLLCGNESKYKLRIGKSDANYGMIFTGNGKGDFEFVPQFKTGLELHGDVRSVLNLGNLFLFGINDRPLVSKEIN